MPVMKDDILFIAYAVLCEICLVLFVKELFEGCNKFRLIQDVDHWLFLTIIFLISMLGHI